MLCHVSDMRCMHLAAQLREVWLVVFLKDFVDFYLVKSAI